MYIQVVQLFVTVTVLIKYRFKKNFVARKGIPSCVLFRGRVRNGIPRIFIYFGSTERNSELCSLPRKGSERNSEIFCSAEEPEFRRKWPFVPTIPSSAELFFWRKFPTLGTGGKLCRKCCWYGAPWLANISTIFKKIRNNLNVIFKGLGEDD